ncbi:MarR family winged helix-turn-helix transcriptional regulator [Kineococcus rhizosphaerae]|uniref:MarR family protein n=1 Tax=Kineococcus rhizosphaerae TaxID=559628 RepID=A0A2T0RAF0_9ACTN|nr:MarR family transcriptional regulator [Kineococcus rhizosphaerae]PRY18142.1 MarR family protein [Kineococcus rhizosphaerae]
METPPTDPLTEAWSPAQVAVMEGLQEWLVGATELHHHLAGWTGLPTSDANALGQVVWAAESGTPLSPAQLSRRLGMTSGATTVLLDRLERAGFVVRSRESTDRRRVTVRPSTKGREEARAFLAFAGTEIAAATRSSDEQELRMVIAFLSRMSAAVRVANGRLSSR